jgi:hypothetical protein
MFFIVEGLKMIILLSSVADTVGTASLIFMGAQFE